MYFVLDDHGDPVHVSDLDTWVHWFERADRGVARTVVTPSIAVLTTFSGVDDEADGRAPLLFETRVFGGVLNGEEVQHATRIEAIAGHAMLVAWCRVGNSPDCGLAETQIT